MLEEPLIWPVSIVLNWDCPPGRLRYVPATGANTIAAGFPSYGPGDRLNIRPGTISSLTVKHAVKLIEVTQKLSQGMSGGPLMTQYHEVIGVIHKGGPDEPRDFAVRLAELKGWIATLP